MDRVRARLWVSLCVVLAAAGSARGQTIDDAIMMSPRALCTGFDYTHDSWSRYWEGRLERSNGNIGTVSTQSISWMGTYGLSERLNVIAMLPWVSTSASAGTMHGMHGLQDATVALKLRLLSADFTEQGALSFFAVGSFATPTNGYTPDFMPMSIGTASRRVSARGTLSFQAKRGWFVETTGAYTWRGMVTLDRSAYFTQDQLYLTDKVAMPDVFDYTVRAGYFKHGLYAPIAFSQQITMGGGDIRRQDMPFVSNRMNLARLELPLMYYLSRPKNFVVHAGAAYTVNGRNVGQATTFWGGLLYTFHF